jgi:hypothetical protein
MDEETRNTAENLLHAVDNEQTERQVQQTTEQSDIEMLRSQIFSFFSDRMQRIQSSEVIKQKIEEQLEAMIDRGDLSFDQMLTVFNMVSKESRTAAESIINLIKPAPGTPSVLANAVGQQENGDEDLERAFNNMSSSDMQTLEKVRKLLESRQSSNRQNRARDANKDS